MQRSRQQEGDKNASYIAQYIKINKSHIIHMYHVRIKIHTSFRTYRGLLLCYLEIYYSC